MQVLATHPVDLPIVTAVIEAALRMDEQRWKARADYVSGRTAGLTTSGVSKVVRRALKALRKRHE